MAPEASEHPTNPMTTLGQVDNDQAGEDQTYVGMDGVPDMQELQGPQGSSDASQEAKVDEPTRSGAPGEQPGCSFGRGVDRLLPLDSWVLGIHRLTSSVAQVPRTSLAGR
jgi:hypothetical protein